MRGGAGTKSPPNDFASPNNSLGCELRRESTVKRWPDTRHVRRLLTRDKPLRPAVPKLNAPPFDNLGNLYEAWVLNILDTHL
jgi:hypothetical protein